MGIHDREWYWDERKRKEKLHYNPKAFRWWKSESVAGPTFERSPGSALGPLLVLAFIVCLVLFLLWRRDDADARQSALAGERAQVARLQAAERVEAVRRQQLINSIQRQETSRGRAIEALKEGDVRTKAAPDEESRRQERWAKFYRPDPSCERSMTVECANAFIRARRRFEAEAR